MAPSIVQIPYEKLLSGADLSKEIETAYGYDGLGILTVSGIPKLMELRSRLIPLARK
jgi:hypothetical protein